MRWPCGSTVTFSEKAAAVEGMPQELLGMAKSRDVLPAMMGPAKTPPPRGRAAGSL